MFLVMVLHGDEDHSWSQMLTHLYSGFKILEIIS